MTPLEIRTLLHIYYSPSPIPNREKDAVVETLSFFVTNNLVEECAEPTDGSGYRLKPRGTAMVNALMGLSLPIEQTRWLIPMTEGGFVEIVPK